MESPDQSPQLWDYDAEVERIKAEHQRNISPEVIDAKVLQCIGCIGIAKEGSEAFRPQDIAACQQIRVTGVTDALKRIGKQWPSPIMKGSAGSFIVRRLPNPNFEQPTQCAKLLPPGEIKPKPLTYTEKLEEAAVKRCIGCIAGRAANIESAIVTSSAIAECIGSNPIIVGTHIGRIEAQDGILVKIRTGKYTLTNKALMYLSTPSATCPPINEQPASKPQKPKKPAKKPSSLPKEKVVKKDAPFVPVKLTKGRGHPSAVRSREKTLEAAVSSCISCIVSRSTVPFEGRVVEAVAIARCLGLSRDTTSKALRRLSEKEAPVVERHDHPSKRYSLTAQAKLIEADVPENCKEITLEEPEAARIARCISCLQAKGYGGERVPIAELALCAAIGSRTVARLLPAVAAEYKSLTKKTGGAYPHHLAIPKITQSVPDSCKGMLPKRAAAAPEIKRTRFAQNSVEERLLKHYAAWIEATAPELPIQDVVQALRNELLIIGSSKEQPDVSIPSIKHGKFYRFFTTGPQLQLEAKATQKAVLHELGLDWTVFGRAFTETELREELQLMPRDSLVAFARLTLLKFDYLKKTRKRRVPVDSKYFDI